MCYWLILLLLAVLLYMLLVWHNVDDLDRWALVKTMQAHKSMMEGSKPTDIFPYMRMLLAVPFVPNHLTHFSEGGIYGAYAFLARRDGSELNSKLYWHKVFANHGINSPELYATCDKGVHDQIVNGRATPFIKKPIIGALGLGVETAASCDTCNEDEQWLCQRRVMTCGGAEHYRVVTLHDSTLFCVYKLRAEGVVSNFARGGSVDLMYDGEKCKDGALPQALSLEIDKLCMLHSSQYDDVFSIGWDVMVDCEQDQAYVLEGNIGHSVWFYPDLMPRRIVDTYRTRLREYVKQRGFM